MGLYCDLIRLRDDEIEKCLSLKDPDEIYAVVQKDRQDDWFELDKAWHGIHFVLNRPVESPPLDFLLRGGKTIIDLNWEDSYGVDVLDMRAFGSVQVKEIFNALSSVSDKSFMLRYNPDLLRSNDIYPHIWESLRDNFFQWALAKYSKVSVELLYLVENLKALRECLRGAAERELGLIVKYHQ